MQIRMEEISCQNPDDRNVSFHKIAPQRNRPAGRIIVRTSWSTFKHPPADRQPGAE
jgi:hypothetical protein